MQMRTFRALIRWFLVALTLVLSSWLFYSEPSVRMAYVSGEVACNSLSFEFGGHPGSTNERIWSDILERTTHDLDSEDIEDMGNELRASCSAARQGRATLILGSMIATGFIFVVLRSPLRDEDHPARRGSVGNYFFPDSTLRDAEPEDDERVDGKSSASEDEEKPSNGDVEREDGPPSHSDGG